MFSCLIIGLGYFTPRHAFGQLFGLYSALFVVYFFLVKTIKNPREIFFTGIFFRLLLLFSIPALSDDFYRFVWDGRLLINGFNPYTILPAEFIQSPDFQAVMGDKSIFQHLNSPNYYTVYPPLNQFIFAISAWLSQGSLFWNVVVLRVFIILATVPEAPPAPRGGAFSLSLSGRVGVGFPPLGAGGTVAKIINTLSTTTFQNKLPCESHAEMAKIN